MARQLLNDDQIAATAEQLRALAHDTRLKLVDRLRVRGELSVGELEQQTGIAQPGLSQQLAILRKADLVTTRRAAKQVYYSLAPAAFMAIVSLLGDVVGARAEVVGAGMPAKAKGSAAMFAKIL